MSSERRAFEPNWPARIAWLVFIVYCMYAMSHLDFSWDRFLAGLEQGRKFIARLFPPNFFPIGRGESPIWKGMSESIQIAVLAASVSILLSLPVALASARNLMPAWLTWPARIVIVLCRTFHPMILAILFVKAVGFGALPGIMALTVAGVGFFGKLLAEAIEEISPKQIEAIRATGAPFMSTVIFAVVPQVFSRFVGFAAYETDSALRNSTMTGIVGAGGIGGTLFAAFQRFDYDFVCAIVLTIIALIVAWEFATNWIKRVFAV